MNGSPGGWAVLYGVLIVVLPAAAVAAGMGAWVITRCRRHRRG